MNPDRIDPITIPTDLMDNTKGCRIGKLCRLLSISHAQAVGCIVMLYHWTAQHVGIHVRNSDDGLAFTARSVCLIEDYADWYGDNDVFVLALEEAGYGRLIGGEFILYAPDRESARVA